MDFLNMLTLIMAACIFVDWLRLKSDFRYIEAYNHQLQNDRLLKQHPDTAIDFGHEVGSYYVVYLHINTLVYAFFDSAIQQRRYMRYLIKAGHKVKYGKRSYNDLPYLRSLFTDPLAPATTPDNAACPSPPR